MFNLVTYNTHFLTVYRSIYRTIQVSYQCLGYDYKAVDYPAADTAVRAPVIKKK